MKCQHDILFLASQHDIISIFVNYRKKYNIYVRGIQQGLIGGIEKKKFFREKDRKEKEGRKEDGILIR